MSSGLGSEWAWLSVCRSSEDQGVFTGNLSDHWSYIFPSGGVVAALPLKALDEQVNNGSACLASATAVFYETIPPGPVEIRTQVMRRGRSAIQAKASMSPVGKPQSAGVEVMGVWRTSRQGPAFQPAFPANVPHWSNLESSDIPITFFGNFETRRVTPLSLTTPRYQLWIRYLNKPLNHRGTMDVCAYPPVIDLMPPALNSIMDNIDFMAPSLDLTMHIFQETPKDWLLLDASVRWTQDGYCSAQIELWDDDQRLLAYGTQMMLLRLDPGGENTFGGFPRANE